MSQVRRTRIVCTIGPSSISPQVMRSMIQSGMDVARLNFSHGDPDTHREAAANVREASEAVGRPVALLGDLQGRKIRNGTVEGTFQKLVCGRTIVLVSGQRHEPNYLEARDIEPVRDVLPFDRVFLE